MSAGAPNVLFISADHWPASLLGCAGHPAILTPTLDNLAHNGVRFPNAYAEAPVCVPARRCMMTGLSPRGHGTNHNARLPMPDVPTLAQTFRNNGYQAYAVGKLHVNPWRQRIGFDDVLLDEEGRVYSDGLQDDYELFLADRGLPGLRFSSGMCNNLYMWRCWDHAEDTHVTNWAARQMCRTIKRRDPLRPAFWYLSFSHPHPPLWPLREYVELYRNCEIPAPYCGDWAAPDQLPEVLKRRVSERAPATPWQLPEIRRAFYALCTHIDHQLRLVIGTLSEEGLLDNTIILFTSDHGDMLGNHGLWAKSQMYQDSNCVPMILSGVKDDERVGFNRVDGRFVGHADIMPTLLNLAGLDIPPHVEGVSMVGGDNREYILSECGDGASATRMLRKGAYKLIYHPQGNIRQLFDLENDPCECQNLAADPAHADKLEELTALMIKNFYGEALKWVREGKLTGTPEVPFKPAPTRGYGGQRGLQFP